MYKQLIGDALTHRRIVSVSQVTTLGFVVVGGKPRNKQKASRHRSPEREKERNGRGKERGKWNSRGGILLILWFSESSSSWTRGTNTTASSSSTAATRGGGRDIINIMEVIHLRGSASYCRPVHRLRHSLRPFSPTHLPDPSSHLTRLYSLSLFPFSLLFSLLFTMKWINIRRKELLSLRSAQTLGRSSSRWMDQSMIGKEEDIVLQCLILVCYPFL